MIRMGGCDVMDACIDARMAWMYERYAWDDWDRWWACMRSVDGLNG